MRSALPCFLFALAFGSTAAAQDMSGNASAASKESGEAAAALAESGVKTASGVVAIPLAVGAAGSAVAGSVAVGVGSAVLGAAGQASVAANASAEYANAPLTVSDEVVVAPQAAPNVPYDAAPAQTAKPRRQP